MTVFEPRVISFVPTKAACSAMTREDESFVGGLGGGGIIDARLLDILAAWKSYWELVCDCLDLVEVNGWEVSVYLKL